MVDHEMNHCIFFTFALLPRIDFLELGVAKDSVYFLLRRMNIFHTQSICKIGAVTN